MKMNPENAVVHKTDDFIFSSILWSVLSNGRAIHLEVGHTQKQKGSIQTLNKKKL